MRKIRNARGEPKDAAVFVASRWGRKRKEEKPHLG